MRGRLPASLTRWPTFRLLFSRPAALTLLLLLGLGLFGPATSHGPLGGSQQIAHADDPDGVITGLDMDPYNGGGNTATSLGSLSFPSDRCAGGTAGDVIEFDVWIDDIEAGPPNDDESILGSAYDLGGWPASGTDGVPPQITVCNHELFLNAAPGSSLDITAECPDGDPPLAVTIVDFGTAEYVSAGFTEGVIGRYTLDTTMAAPGLYMLTLSNVVHSRDVPPGGQVPNQAIWDSNYSDAFGPYGMVAIDNDCPGGGSDVKKLSLSPYGLPPGNQGLVSISNWFELRAALHNNGPDEPVDVEDVTAIAVPAGVQLSFHVTNVNQTVTIDGTPLDSTAIPPGVSIAGGPCVAGACPVCTVVAVNGDEVTGTVLDVHETLTLPESVQTNVDQDWAFHCLTGGSIPLHWDNTVETLAPSYDYDPTNNSGSLDITLDCFGPPNGDVKISDQYFTSLPPVRPPLTLPTIIVDEDSNLSLRKVLHNNGPFLGVPTDITKDVSLSYTGMDPANGDCVVTPNPATDQVDVNMSVFLDHDETFNIACGQGGIAIDDDADTATDEDPIGGSGVDSDGDTEIDEDACDGTDNDGDTQTDEDDPNGDDDCDGSIDEDSPYYLVTVTVANEIMPKPAIGDPNEADNVAESSVTLAVATDTDGDDWIDGAEQVITTDPADDCPDDPSDDAWPPDEDNSTEVNILDVLLFKPVLGGSYDPRYDLDAGGAVDILDVLMYKPYINASCTNP